MSAAMARNAAVVVLLALVVWLVPGGGEGAEVVGRILNATFIVVAVLIVATLYRRFRGEIFGLGDQWRFALYAAVGVALLTVSVTGRLWATSAGGLIWFALVGSASYTLYVVWQRYRSLA